MGLSIGPKIWLKTHSTRLQVLNSFYDGLFLAQGILGIGRHIWDVRATDAVKIAQVVLHSRLRSFVLTFYYYRPAGRFRLCIPH